MKLLTTPETRRRYARMVLEHDGAYLRLADPDTFAYYYALAHEPRKAPCPPSR